MTAAQVVPPPTAEFRFLETLWFQISGTLCNLRCTHCFISCAPDNHRLEMMDAQEVFRYLDEAKKLGVKEIYYTGGEPFIHKEFMEILERTLSDFPVSVLSNGLLITQARADRLKEIADQSRYSLEIRISIDDCDESRNDAIRGQGTFQKILAAYKCLYERGFLPILTVTEIQDYLKAEHGDASESSLYDQYAELLRAIGVDRPRIKIIPVFEMGMLPLPQRPTRVTHQMMKDFDHSLLQCSSSRIVAHDGIYACPILVGEEKARMGGGSLAEALHPCSLYHTSCNTCYVTGMTCKNY